MKYGNNRLREIHLKNLLSFGEDSLPLTLRPLNVLIGPNGSGKSNLIEAISFMRATPGDMREVVLRGGGAEEWIHKNSNSNSASIELRIPSSIDGNTLAHFIEFEDSPRGFGLCTELVFRPNLDEDDPKRYYYIYDGEKQYLTFAPDGLRHSRTTPPNDKSGLAQFRDPVGFPELTFLEESYEGFRIYRDWNFGRNTKFRSSQKADQRSQPLSEDFSNLGLFLSELRKIPSAKKSMLEGLNDLYSDFTDFDIHVQGGMVQIFFSEGDYSIPATRLSDGTLRYLGLLAILCDPIPPPLICIEEPELGLHPDIIPKLADLLVAASSRTQLIVTTHSEILVDALTETPESIIVCEKENGQTHMRRLDRADLDEWLKSYRLGELWSRGHLGGNRW